MKTINRILLFALAIMTISCEDIFEEDITDDSVSVVSPLKDQKIESNVVRFQWNAIKGADKYRVQIYDVNESIVLDSLTDKTNLSYSLIQGDYQWRVRGENSAYQSTYSFPVAFSTSVSDDLTNQKVIIDSPVNNAYYSSFANVTLSWQLLANASSYSVEITNIVNGQQVYTNASIIETSVTVSVPNLNDGSYEWRLKAKNSTSTTQQYSTRKFYIDTTKPNQVQNQTPANDTPQTIKQQISFTWTETTDSGTISPISYKIEFSNDENFTSITQKFNANTTTSQQIFTEAGIYYWRIKAVDGAGNESVPSTPYKFTIN